MRKFGHYFLEGFLIVFSVLFALYIENYVQELKIEKQKQLALERIKLEVERNARVLASWIPHHEKIYQHLSVSSLDKTDTLRNALLKYNYFNFDIITSNKQLFQEVLTNTAWETAKSTGIIAEFDFELVEYLTQVYALQNVIMNNTLEQIMSNINNKESHDLQNIAATLKQTEIRFRELTGQEKRLEKLYSTSLIKLN